MANKAWIAAASRDGNSEQRAKLRNGGGEKKRWRRLKRGRGEGGGGEEGGEEGGEGGEGGGKRKIHSDKEQSKEKQTDLPVV